MSEKRMKRAGWFGFLVACLVLAIGVLTASIFAEDVDGQETNPEIQSEGSENTNPSISDVSARQRWPWNGLVDIDYKITGETKGMYVVISVKDTESGQTWEATKFYPGTEPSASEGTHRATWDALQDGATDVVSSNVIATVALMRPNGTPIAMADTNTFNEADVTLNVTEESDGVLANDDFGPDANGSLIGVAAGEATDPPSGKVGEEVEGTYGKLTLNADGTYSYTLTQDIAQDKTVEDIFTYAIEDGNGDIACTTLTIAIKGDTNKPSITLPEEGSDALKVYESALDASDTQQAGSNPDATTEATSGEITLTLNGKAAALTIGNLNFDIDTNGDATVEDGSNAISTDKGILTITGIKGGIVSYAYTLTASQDQSESDVADKFAISVIDATNNAAAEQTLSITIVDDVPVLTVNADTLTVYEAGLSNGSQTDDVDVSAQGTMTLVSGADGLQGFTISFGDDQSATVLPAEDGALAMQYGNISFSYSDGTLTYIYALTNRAEHPGQGKDEVTESFSVTATDNDGDTSDSQSVTVTVLDDVPVAQNDNIIIDEESAKNGYTGESVLSNDTFGADEPAEQTVTSIENGTIGTAFTGAYGIFVMNEDGSYTYTLTQDIAVGESKTDTLTYTITDEDGDTSEAQLSITIEGVEDQPPVITLGDALMVYESGLDGNNTQHAGTESDNNSEYASGSFNLELNGQAGNITIGTSSIYIGADGNGQSDSGGNAITTDKGILTINEIKNSVVKYTYELTSSQDHSNGDVTDSFTVSFTNSLGATAEEKTLIISIVDDDLTATADCDSFEADTAKTGCEVTDAAKGVLSNDIFGADVTAEEVVGVCKGNSTDELSSNVGSEIDGEYGKLTLSADGTYQYTLTANLGSGMRVDDVFSYTIKDSDDDYSTTTLTITIEATVLNITVTSNLVDGEATTLVDESASAAFVASNESLLEEAPGQEVAETPVEPESLEMPLDEIDLVLVFESDGEDAETTEVE